MEWKIIAATIGALLITLSTSACGARYGGLQVGTPSALEQFNAADKLAWDNRRKV